MHMHYAGKISPLLETYVLTAVFVVSNANQSCPIFFGSRDPVFPGFRDQNGQNSVPLWLKIKWEQNILGTD